MVREDLEYVSLFHADPVLDDQWLLNTRHSGLAPRHVEVTDRPNHD
jgi:hypothetical protein